MGRQGSALVMPGGLISVTRGLLSHMTNEAQLASVLGHEVAHVTARHSLLDMVGSFPTDATDEEP